MPRRSTTFSVTGPQLRAARALLNLPAKELAETTGISFRTIMRAESAKGAATLTTENAERLVGALQALGIVFVVESGDTIGVMLRKHSAEPR